jgi:hypothetical protein
MDEIETSSVFGPHKKLKPGDEIRAGPADRRHGTSG